ncbi:adenylate cyclase type 10 [Pterocles gutturalis]
MEQQSGMLAFCVPLLQAAAYELWCKSQRDALHHKALTMASVWERKPSRLEKAASFLPDLVKVFPKGAAHSDTGVLLFADVSGFTPLTEKLVLRSGVERGTDELVRVLNGFLHDVLEDILVFGGDILKFAGDAVLVLWKSGTMDQVKTISLVLQCSLQIQKKHRHYNKLVDHKITVKIGSVRLLTVGDKRKEYFVIYGEALNDVSEAESHAKAGEVILSESAWTHCEQHQIRTKRLKGTKAVKVTSMTQMSQAVRQEILQKLAGRSRGYSLQGPGFMRPSAFFVHKSEMEDVLRKCIAEAALRKIDDRVPLTFFSELRPVTILFIKLLYTESRAEIRTIHQNTTSMILETLHPHKGELNKIILFDKGSTFLCVFGLPGGKMLYETLHALQSAIQILNSCTTVLKGQVVPSVAVTKGVTFCGISGHPERQDYTVLGQKVNLAARMIMCYPGVVSCSDVAYAASQLPPEYFKELPLKEMKGISCPVTVYQYVGVTKESIFGVGMTKTKSEYGPLLERKKETELFGSCLKAYKESGETHILAFEGAVGAGKSHLLTELVCLGRDADHRVVTVELQELNVRQAFCAIRTLMARALDLQDCEQCSERQERLEEKLQGIIEESSYCLLNDILLVEFPISDNVSKMRETQLKEELHSTLLKVLEKIIGGENDIYVIDNAHFIDPVSWTIMLSVMQNASFFMVVSLAPGYTITESFCKPAAYLAQKITFLHLDGLKPSSVVQKACHDLGVVSISRDLERFLIQRSSGNPYYCKELLRCLRCEDLLLFRTQRRAEEAEDSWESLSTSAAEASPIAESSSSSAGNDGKVCILRPDVNLENMVLPDTLKEIALAQLDQLKPLERLIVKFAAIIGPMFTTQLLSHILPTEVKYKMNCLLTVLVDNNVFKWLKSREVPDVQDCGVEKPSASRKTMEQQSGMLAFCVPLLQAAAYELWRKSQRDALHRKCATFLEPHAHQCKSCGQGDFVPFHRFAVSGAQDGGSGDGPADQGDSHSWEALVFAGEELRRERTHTTNGVSDADRCECSAIVESVHAALARHYMAMGDTARAFYYLLECVAAYLHTSNSSMALKKLNEAEVLRDSAEKQATGIARFEEATFFSLKGEVCFRMGHKELAEKMIRKALKLFKLSFPRTSLGALAKSQLEKLQRVASVIRRAFCIPQEAGRKSLAWLRRQSHCLSLLEGIFSPENTSRRQRLSHLVTSMKANRERAASFCWEQITATE